MSAVVPDHVIDWLRAVGSNPTRDDARFARSALECLTGMERRLQELEAIQRVGGAQDDGALLVEGAVFRFDLPGLMDGDGEAVGFMPGQEGCDSMVRAELRYWPEGD